MDFSELKHKLEEVRDMGYVPSSRSSDTGVGYTLEQLLGIDENHFPLPDIGDVELKSHRRGSSSMITLFTLDRRVWRGGQADFIFKYGGEDRKGRPALKSTVSVELNSRGLQLSYAEGTLQLKHGGEDKILAEWSPENLMERFKEKIPNLVLVIADTKKDSSGKEKFYYNEAYLLRESSGEKFIELIQAGRILVDLRMHIKEGRGSVRNHGTGFRIQEQFLQHCFSEKEKIL